LIVWKSDGDKITYGSHDVKDEEVVLVPLPSRGTGASIPNWNLIPGYIKDA
jgi:hypothetical protein